MKIFTLIALLFFSGYSYARQYIQCASTDVNSTDGAVINLDNDQSTLYMVSGMGELGEFSLLKSIEFKEIVGEFTIYQSENHESIETVKIPTAVLGKFVKNFPVTIELVATDHSTYSSQDLVCYSAIYN